MIIIPDDYADLLKDILDLIIIEAKDTSRVLRALEKVLEDIFSNRNSEDWYYNLQYAKDQLQKVREKTI
ncbi:MAG: hypothetical protein LBC64_07565 [Fibromonadaceae bacterium]|jgi:hypothetical protein|nr:hypothetical protein [Fibromonadaceae bacterium]